MSLTRTEQGETPPYNPEESQRRSRLRCGCGSAIVFGLSTLALVGEILIPGVKQLAGEVTVIATSGVIFLSGTIAGASLVSLNRLYHEDTRRMQEDNNKNSSPSSGATQH